MVSDHESASSGAVETVRLSPCFGKGREPARAHPMKLPFVTRSHYEEMVGELRRQLAERERELYRLKDLIFKEHFGVQLHDTIAGEMKPVEPDAKLSREEEAAEEMEAERAADRARLASIRRTQPSRLGVAMADVMRKDMVRRAKAARPTTVVSPAEAIFNQAKQEALR